MGYLFEPRHVADLLYEQADAEWVQDELEDGTLQAEGKLSLKPELLTEDQVTMIGTVVVPLRLPGDTYKEQYRITVERV